MIPVEVQGVSLGIRGIGLIGLLDLCGKTSREKASLLVIPRPGDGGKGEGTDFLLPAAQSPVTHNEVVVRKSEIVVQLKSRPATKEKRGQKGMICP